ncbi:Phosphotyrosine-binding domain [Binucleata daphniae]
MVACIVPQYYSQAEPIGGDGSIVQIDEFKFGKRKYEKGHKVDGVWVLGVVEKVKKKEYAYLLLKTERKLLLQKF